MSEELLKIADGLLAVSEGVRALAGKAHSCNCSKNQEEGRGQKDEESGNEKIQEKQENAVTIEQVRAVMASKSQDGKTQQVKANLKIDSNANIVNLFKMTPYYYKTGVNDQQKINNLDYLETQAEFEIRIYRKD